MKRLAASRVSARPAAWVLAHGGKPPGRCAGHALGQSGGEPHALHIGAAMQNSDGHPLLTRCLAAPEESPRPGPSPSLFGNIPVPVPVPIPVTSGV